MLDGKVSNWEIFSVFSELICHRYQQPVNTIVFQTLNAIATWCIASINVFVFIFIQTQEFQNGNHNLLFGPIFQFKCRNGLVIWIGIVYVQWIVNVSH